MEESVVLNLDQRHEWAKALEGLTNGTEPYYQPGFYAASEHHHQAKAECFIFRKDHDVVVYPYLKRELKKWSHLFQGAPLYDIVGGYGYNGCLASASAPSLGETFRKSFELYCRKAHILTEFVRFHPLLENHRHFVSNMDVSVQNMNIAIDLTLSLEKIRARYDYSCRKNIKKALREGVRVFIDEGMSSRFDDFIRIYESTMKRVSARKEYGFDRAYFEILCAQLRPVPLMVYAQCQGKIVSCEMVLRSNRIIYSYLGGTDEESFPVRPNNLLKDCLIAWAGERGYTWYLLGGGSRPGDGVFRYKRTFAPDGIRDFRVGTRVHDPIMYDKIISEWERYAPPEAKKSLQIQRYWD